MIACVKPYGVPSQPDKTYGVDMVTLVKEYLYESDSEIDGEPYVAVINRLDRPVGGIILFAKDEDTAAKLTDMVQDREISKYYQVVVSGFMEEPEGEMSDWLLHDKRTNISKIVPKGTKGAKKAELFYEVLDELELSVLHSLEVDLLGLLASLRLLRLDLYRQQHEILLRELVAE